MTKKKKYTGIKTHTRQPVMTGDTIKLYKGKIYAYNTELEMLAYDKMIESEKEN